MSTVPFNVNHNVYVRLTDTGRAGASKLPFDTNIRIAV